MGPKWIEFFVVYENERTNKVQVHIKDGQDESDGFVLAARAAKTYYEYAPIHMIQYVRAADTLEELTGERHDENS